jgi:hypothetical protein
LGSIPFHRLLNKSNENFTLNFIDEKAVNSSSVIGDNTVTTKHLGDYTFYQSNPMVFEFAKMKRTGGLERELEARPTGVKHKDAAGVTYHELTAEGKTFYLPENAERSGGVVAENYLDWKQFFDKYESDGDGDLVCDIEGIISHVEKASDGTAGRSKDGKITYKELEAIFKERGKHQEIRAGLRRIVCKHPLEWNKELYNDDFREKLGNRFMLRGERYELLKERCEKLDLWNDKGAEKGVKGILKCKDDNLWFAHPVYFLNHLDKAGLLDQSFNPYLGTHKTVDGVTFTCYDNPGFAPVYTVGTEVFEGHGKRFAVINGLFNDDYSHIYGKRFFHEGIDFKGDGGTKIISFVYGTVVFAGEMTAQAGYGTVMIIKDNQKDILYLLAHLSKWLVNENEPVYPDMEVAEVGSTGTKKPHLHVSVLETNKGNKPEIVTEVSPGKYQWNISIFNLCRDPFNQTITRIP